MKKILSSFFLFLLIIPASGIGNTIEQALFGQIAVEKQTGESNSYETSFSGSVGSMSIDLLSKKIYIAELLLGGNQPAILNTNYDITSIEIYEKNLDFECVDVTPLTSGQEWRGKIWLSDYGRVNIDMVMKQSPRKWVNLGKFGRRWMKENKLNHLNLGAFEE